MVLNEKLNLLVRIKFFNLLYIYIYISKIKTEKFTGQNKVFVK
jgi:hypothetical protein